MLDPAGTPSAGRRPGCRTPSRLRAHGRSAVSALRASIPRAGEEQAGFVGKRLCACSQALKRPRWRVGRAPAHVRRRGACAGEKDMRARGYSRVPESLTPRSPNAALSVSDRLSCSPSGHRFPSAPLLPAWLVGPRPLRPARPFAARGPAPLVCLPCSGVRAARRAAALPRMAPCSTAGRGLAQRREPYQPPTTCRQQRTSREGRLGRRHPWVLKQDRHERPEPKRTAQSMWVRGVTDTLTRHF